LFRCESLGLALGGISKVQIGCLYGLVSNSKTVL
jgi:hypothetical protein